MHAPCPGRPSDCRWLDLDCTRQSAHAARQLPALHPPAHQPPAHQPTERPGPPRPSSARPAHLLHLDQVCNLCALQSAHVRHVAGLAIGGGAGRQRARLVQPRPRPRLERLHRLLRALQARGGLHRCRCVVVGLLVCKRGLAGKAALRGGAVGPSGCCRRSGAAAAESAPAGGEARRWATQPSCCAAASSWDGSRAAAASSAAGGGCVVGELAAVPLLHRQLLLAGFYIRRRRPHHLFEPIDGVRGAGQGPQ